MSPEDEKKLAEFRQTVDVSEFKNEPYVRRVEKPWGYELHWVPDGFPYMGKILHLDEGKRMSLQVHDPKQETFFLFEGEMIVVLESTDGEMEKFVMEPLKGYVVGHGQKHRLIGGKGGGSVVESSAPETGNTYRLEDDFKRPTETEEERERRNTEAITS